MKTKYPNLSEGSTNSRLFTESKLSKEFEEISPVIKKILVTPEKAKELLSGNTHNRRPNEKTVKRYADDMRAGRWKQNTFEFIKIQADGTIADGQHRLIAVVKSGCPIVFDVVYNVSPEVFTVLDTGKHRNGSDTFKVMQIKNDNTLPSIIQAHQAFIIGYTSRGTGMLTNEMLLDEYNKNPEFWQFVARHTTKWYADFAKILQPSTIGGVYSYLCLIDSDKAFKFMDQLCTGAEITNKTVLILRNRLIQDKTALRRISLSHKIAFIIKTWNAFKTNQEFKILKFSPEIEDFPKAI